MQAKGGWNNNPNVIQFMSAMRRMVLGNAVTASKNANCRLYGVDVIIPLFHTRMHAASLNDSSTEPTQEGTDTEEDGRLKRLINQVKFRQPSEFKANVLTYVAGLVTARYNCSYALTMTTTES